MANANISENLTRLQFIKDFVSANDRLFGCDEDYHETQNVSANKYRTQKAERRAFRRYILNLPSLL